MHIRIILRIFDDFLYNFLLIIPLLTDLSEINLNVLASFLIKNDKKLNLLFSIIISSSSSSLYIIICISINK